MPIRIPAPLEEQIDAFVSSGQYPDAESVLAAAISALKEREGCLAWLRSELASGQADEERGDVIAFTADHLESIKRRGRQALHSGKPIIDAVQP